MSVFGLDRHGEGRRIVGTIRLTDRAAREMVIREMIVMRSRGYTDTEIGVKYRYRRETVNRMINGAPADVKARLRDVKLV